MNKIFVRFCILQAAFWSFFASLPGYITAYMLERGMNAGTLGVLLAVNMGFSFAGSLFWGRFVDRRQGHKQFFLIGIGAAFVLGTLLFLFAGSPVVLFVLYPIFGFMMGPIATTLDSWVICAMHQVEAGAKSRTFGTLGYAFTMLGAGQLITRFGYGIMPFMAAGFLILAFLIALTQPKTELTVSGPASQPVKANPSQLLHSRKYLLLVAAVLFTGMTIAPINNMKVLIFENVGGNVSFLGWDSFIGCLIQSPFLIFSGKMDRMKSESRLTLGTLCAFGYALLVFLAHTPAMVIAGTIMTNISFGLLFPTMREITEESVHPTLRTTAHSIIDVAYGSVSGMIASAWGGVTMESSGPRVMTSICMGLGIVAMLFCILLTLHKNEKSAVREKISCETAV